MSYADSITSLANQSVTVTRRQVSSRIKGRAQPPVVTTFAITASVQATSGRDLKRLPDGRITGDVWTVYTRQQLFIGCTEAGSEAGYQPDLLQIDGKLCEIEHLETWPHLGSVYYKAICRAVTA